MNKKIIATALIAGTVGFVLGNAFWYLASPLWIDRVVHEELSGQFQNKALVSGKFKDADAAHKGKGTATVFEDSGGRQILRFTDFEATNGPDLKVWLVKAGQANTAKDVTSSEWVSLGPLKGNIGDQNYSLPADVKAGDYGSVVIWCRQFGVLFASASLSPAP